VSSDPPVDRVRRFWPWSILWAILFAIAHTQSPLYYSNQHQYMLHGLADAGVGHLNEDWLANTKDSTPAFSAMVSVSYKLFGPFSLQVIYFLLLGVYFESVRRLIVALPGFPARGPAHVLFPTLFLAAHAAILRVAAIRFTGVDWPWYLQCGLANQYVLGPGLQPSVFGILLITSLSAFANGRPILAAALAAASAVMHSTYLLPAGLMTLGYMLVLCREGNGRRALTAGGLALAIVLPVVFYNVRSFSLGDADELAAAQMILVEIRIPHHAVVERWLDTVAWIQIAIMLVGLSLVWRSRAFPVLALGAAAALALTVVQALTDNRTLALLFPWRFSAVLMPVATAVILAKAVQLICRRMEDSGHASRAVVWASGLAATALAAGGIAVTALGIGYAMNDAELPLLDHVRDHKKPGEVYLLPVKFPTLKKETPALQSKTFAPPVRTGAVGIPVDLQRFRLHTGAPIYVDFKAVPYAPAEVHEWAKRMNLCEMCYRERDWDRPADYPTWQLARDMGVTHVVTTADRELSGQMLELVYSDESYRLYRIRR
jgi:Domain of unknown function (DUF6798)